MRGVLGGVVWVRGGGRRCRVWGPVMGFLRILNKSRLHVCVIEERNPGWSKVPQGGIQHVKLVTQHVVFAFCSSIRHVPGSQQLGQQCFLARRYGAIVSKVVGTILADTVSEIRVLAVILILTIGFGIPLI